MMEFLTMWLLVAALTEGITEIIKSLFPDKIRDKATYVTSLGVGIGLAFAFGVNPFGLIGAAQYVSIVAAGILASRGANYLHGFMKKIGIIKPVE